MLLLAAVILSCKAKESAKDKVGTQATGQSLSKTTENGPIKATVTVTPKEPTLGDIVRVVLQVEAAAGVDVRMPAFGEALGRFNITEFTPRTSSQPLGATVYAQEYALDAPMSGSHMIPSFLVEFVDRRPGQTSGEFKELLTEEISIQVKSVLGNGNVANELRPARGVLPETVTKGGPPWLPIAAGALMLVAILVGGWLWSRHRASHRTRASAFDVAWVHLQALGGLPSEEAADAWYVALSGIIRRYLEDRYALRAPELTTEEFLREAGQSAELRSEHSKLLGAFLEHCDRVKFAAYRPRETESRETLEAARRFLKETRLQSLEVPLKEAA